MMNLEENELLKTALDIAREKTVADGCVGCAFTSTYEWELPCRKCKRNCKDYYRRQQEDE